MTELVTAAQMRAHEAQAIESGRVTGLELMERAGQGTVDAVLKEWPKLAKGAFSAVVLCGPGNNGGDGYVIARLLEARGWQVTLWALAPPSARCPDAVQMAQAWGGTPVSLQKLQTTRAPHLVVDALFGTGQTRPIPPEVADLFRMIREKWTSGTGRRSKKVAVDIASGLCSDSGRLLQSQDDPRETLSDGWPGFMDWCFDDDLTVTFGAPKVGHYLDASSGLGGKRVCVDLPGLPPLDSPWDLDLSHPGHVRLIEPVFMGRATPVSHWLRDLDKSTGHKFDHGHALILTGGFGRTGAARLAARAALRIGAGLVTLGAPGASMMECAAQITALMLRRVQDATGLREALQDDRLNALCLGPGLGLDRARDLVPAALASGRPAVLDADALSAFAETPDTLFKALHPDCVLTPHGGEFARLFPDLAQDFEGWTEVSPARSKVDVTRAAAARAGCTVLFKGVQTVIAAPDGRASIHSATAERAVPWLATAGAGDVLAGMITGLLARGVAPTKSAEAATWLHVEAARSFGPGLIAEDLPETLPSVLGSLTEH